MYTGLFTTVCIFSAINIVVVCKAVSLLQEDEPEALITGEALDEWVGSIAGRVSPEGGEDSGHNGADSPDSMLQSSKTKDKVRMVFIS